MRATHEPSDASSAESSSTARVASAGLVLFPPGTSAVHKRRRLIFLAIHLLVAIGLVWPLPSLLRGPLPLLGLPAPMTWAIFLLATEFCALWWLFRGENDSPKDN